MTKDKTSLLLISPDDALSTSINKVLADEPDLQITTKTGWLSGLNGSVVPLASRSDIVVFSINPDDEGEIETIRSMAATRAPGSMVLALTETDIPLSKARALAKAGVDEVLPREALEGELQEQISAWKSRRDSQLPAIWSGQDTQGRIIATAQARGGVGASTLAVNLADALVDRKGLIKKVGHNRVAVVDLDIQFGSVATLLDVAESDAFFRMAINETVPDADFLSHVLETSAGGLTVLSAPSRFVPLDALTGQQIGAILDELRKTHDYVVVDLPHALVPWLDPVLSKADHMMLVTDVTVPSIRSARKLIDFFLAEHPSLEIETVVNFEKKPLVQASHHREAQKVLERKFKHWLPNDPRAARETLDRGKPLGELAPRSDLARAIKNLAKDTMTAYPRPQARVH